MTSTTARAARRRRVSLAAAVLALTPLALSSGHAQGHARAGAERSAQAPDPAAHAEPPNIVVFLVDDLGASDTSVPFVGASPWPGKFRTPALEALAARGMKFSQAYACSVCSPTRVSMMTGLNAARHRVTNWTLHQGGSNDRPHPRLSFPDWNVNGLSPIAGVPNTVHCRPLPSFLQNAGYTTIHVGKAHLGAVGTPGADPGLLGFDVNIGGHAAGGPGSYYGQEHYSARLRRRPPPVETAVWDIPHLEAYHGKDVFLTEALTREALRAVERALDADQRFFLHLSHYAVHAPIMPDPRFTADGSREVGVEDAYASLVAGMDRSLADVLSLLRRRGIEEQTVVIFLSDNGGLSATGRGGAAHQHNLPLSSGKGSAREGGVRVPMVVCWPGVIEAGSRCTVPTMVEDLFPTLLDLAGVPHEGRPAIDGQSFAAALRGEEFHPTRPLLWHYPNHWGPQGPGIGPSSAIRVGDWKLIYYHDPGRHDPGRAEAFELFDLAGDLGETRNLVATQPERAEGLADELQRALIERAAQMPTLRATGQPVPWPHDAWLARR